MALKSISSFLNRRFDCQRICLLPLDEAIVFLFLFPLDLPEELIVKLSQEIEFISNRGGKPGFKTQPGFGPGLL